MIELALGATRHHGIPLVGLEEALAGKFPHLVRRQDAGQGAVKHPLVLRCQRRGILSDARPSADKADEESDGKSRSTPAPRGAFLGAVEEPAGQR